MGAFLVGDEQDFGEVEVFAEGVDADEVVLVIAEVLEEFDAVEGSISECM